MRSRRSPEQFSGEVLAKIISLTAYLALRSHYLLATRIEQYNRLPQGRGRVELPPTFTERVVPQSLSLHESLAEVLHTQAAVARAWALARSKRIEGDRAGGNPSAKATPKGKAKARREPKSAPAHGDGKHNGNGKPGINRIADLRDGRGPEANGVHHDD